jgi:hypothetical protein
MSLVSTMMKKWKMTKTKWRVMRRSASSSSSLMMRLMKVHSLYSRIMLFLLRRHLGREVCFAMCLVRLTFTQLIVTKLATTIIFMVLPTNLALKIKLTIGELAQEELSL